MKVLGIDPGVNKTGFGIVEKKGSKLKVLDIGIIQPAKNNKIDKKIFYLHKKLTKICDLYEPEECSIEELFFVKNVKSGIKVGQMRGVAILTMAQKKIPVFNYTPTKIKLAVVGNGNAKKEQVKEMVKLLTGFKTEKKLTYDAYDAVAAAICHLNNRRIKQYDSLS